MSYIKHKFYEFEEDTIEKHLPDVKYEENETGCWYEFPVEDLETFNRKFHKMMEELLVMNGVGAGEFWVDPEEGIFCASPAPLARNIWEYYRYVCKELSK
jgi:hypothetical protein